jgi:hypothetical protein
MERKNYVSRPRGSGKVEQATRVLVAFWGPNGADKVLRRDEIRQMKLSKDDREALMDALPPPSTVGTTGERIAECYRFLERL